MLNKTIIHFSLGLSLVCLAACKTHSNQNHSAVKDIGGAAKVRNAWLLSPEALEGTLTKTWGLPMTAAEKWKYIGSVHSFLGGTDIASFKGSVDQPNSLFILSIANLASFAATRLVDKEISMASQGQAYIFEGMGLSEPNEACFKNDQAAWCDAVDNIRIGSLSENGLTVAGLNTEWRKRLMHNIQDLGEFMLIDLDNTTQVPDGTGRHAAQYLLEDMLIPTLGEGAITRDAEIKAWRNVLMTSLIGGGFFMGITPNASLPPAVVSFSSGDQPMAIPDFANSAAGILRQDLSPQTTSPGVIRRVKVRGSFNHPQRGQLRVDLTRGSKTVTIYQGATDPNRNFANLDLALDSADNANLKAFEQMTAGPWSLAVYDNKPFEKGTLKNFTVTIEYGD